MKFKLFLKQQYIFIILINLYIGKQFSFNENNICMLKAIILPNIVNMIPIKLYILCKKNASGKIKLYFYMNNQCNTKIRVNFYQLQNPLSLKWLSNKDILYYNVPNIYSLQTLNKLL